MKNYLLDTHTLLWMHDDSKEISQEIKDTLSSNDSQLFLSVASLWEITIKQQINKLHLEYSLDDIAAYCLDNNISIKPILLYYLNQYSLLPLIHRDPFDRVIVATAYFDNLTLVSKDKQLSAYNIQIIW
ncbi:MAG: type II toxin-antitoxin system VapC family toxin [Segetibacter sp.]